MVKKAIRVNQGDLLADENGVHGEKKIPKSRDEQESERP
jgi:hypothetical protein